MFSADSEAPTFPSGLPGWKSSRYPLGGAKTGPAWRAMWRALGGLPDGEWVSGDALVSLGAIEASCTPETCRVLLTRAANAGVLERERRLVAQRYRNYYRQSIPAYRWIVEALKDGRFRTVLLEGDPGAEYLEELVQRGALERRWNGRSQYRLTWKVPQS